MNIFCLIQHLECNTPHIADPHENRQSTLIVRISLIVKCNQILLATQCHTRTHILTRQMDFSYERHGMIRFIHLLSCEICISWIHEQCLYVSTLVHVQWACTTPKYFLFNNEKLIIQYSRENFECQFPSFNDMLLSLLLGTICLMKTKLRVPLNS